MSVKICDLYYYPVKGLSAQKLPSVRLIPGEGFPLDRVYGLARHDSGYDPEHYQPLPKTRFIVLVKEERLAGLTTFLDPETRRLAVRVQDQLVLDEDLESAEGRNKVCRFFSNMFDLKSNEEPTLAMGRENRFTDISVDSRQMMNAISLINLNSVKDFGRRTNMEVDPLRFRANLYFDGMAPHQELEMVGQEIQIGAARLKICRRTRRCAATDVDPSSAMRNMAIPRTLMKHLGHADMGVYAEVLEGGSIAIGSPISIC